ncbi:MAG: alpha-amylase family glycosyl hydrolase [Candidatus Gottesmanbacteria bacterium]
MKFLIIIIVAGIVLIALNPKVIKLFKRYIPWLDNQSVTLTNNFIPEQNYPVLYGFSAQKRIDTKDFVIYQVWLNYYAKNPGNNQTSTTVFENAASFLPSLAKMGVTIIQLSPVHPFGNFTTVGSPYGIKDYYDVNPGYAGFPNPASNPGTRDERVEAFKTYVAKAHQQGMKVIMDCIYHSTDPDNVLINSHPDFYVRSNGKVEKNKWGFAVLDYSNPEVRTYMINMTKYWASTVGVDGLRADVAIQVPLSFWAQLNNELKKMKPDWIMIAESGSKLAEYGGIYSGLGYNGESYDQVYGFDGIYGFAYMRALRWILDNKQPASILSTAWQYPEGGKPPSIPSLIIYRTIDNHDQRPRAAALASGNAGMMAAMVINLTLDGIPFIFNGQEIGDTNNTGVAIQRFVSWSKPPHPENTAVLQQLITLRKTHPALHSGTTTWYSTNLPDKVVSYLRTGGGEKILVVVNLSGNKWNGIVTGPDLNGTLTDLINSQKYFANAGKLSLSLPAYSYLIAKK